MIKRDTSRNLRSEYVNMKEKGIPESDIKMRYRLARGMKYKYFIFVEGPTDNLFYSNCAFDWMAAVNSCYFFGPSQNNKEEKAGKKWVIDAYKMMNSYIESQKDRKQLVFIVDRDYEPADLVGINNTRYHSIESYFFIPENLALIFRKICAERYEEFLELADDFTRNYFNYFLLCATISKAHEMNWFKYGSTVKQNDMTVRFHKGTPITYAYPRECKMEEQNMLNKICSGKQPNAKSYYDKLCFDYPVCMVNIRGHNSLNFLQEYCQKVLEQDFDYPRICGFAKQMKLDIELVNIDGQQVIGAADDGYGSKNAATIPANK